MKMTILYLEILMAEMQIVKNITLVKKNYVSYI